VKGFSDGDAFLSWVGDLIVKLSAHHIEGGEGLFGVGEGRVASEGFVEGCADGVDIDAVVAFHGADLLRSHIGGCTEDNACFGEAFIVLCACESKVGKFDLIILCNQDIGGFDIAMDDAFAVSIGEGGEDLCEDAEEDGEGEAGLCVRTAEKVLEVVAFDKFHYDKEFVLIFEDAADADDILMDESGLGTRFTQEALRIDQTAFSFFFQAFDGDGKLHEDIATAINDRRAAFAKQRFNLIDPLDDTAKIDVAFFFGSHAFVFSPSCVTRQGGRGQQREKDGAVSGSVCGGAW
jgi:hypothetical protein